MAIQILVTVEGKKWEQINRKDYLNAHVDAFFALQGSRPD
jgi:hypothetical protein